MVNEMEYARGVRTFTIEELDGYELLHVEREEAGTLVTPARARPRWPPSGPTTRARPCGCAITNRPAVTVLARIDAVPGFGWRGWPGGSVPVAPVEARPLRLSNGLVTVQVDPTDGTFAIGDLAGLGGARGRRRRRRHLQLVPADRRHRDRPSGVGVVPPPGARPAPGPPRGSAHLRAPDPRRGPAPRRARTRCRCAPRSSSRPATTSCGCRSSSTTTACATTASASTSPCRGRRPPRRPSARSPSSSAASPPRAGRPRSASRRSRRGASSGPAGSPWPTRASSSTSWSTCATARPTALALTLLRCTGMLSQGPMATRPLPAGPLTPMEGPQQQVPVSVRFARPRRRPRPLRGRRRRVPAAARHAGRRGRGADRGPGPPASSGAEVSAVVRVADALHVRVFNPTAERHHGAHRRTPGLARRPPRPPARPVRGHLRPRPLADRHRRDHLSIGPRRAPCGRRSGPRGVRGWRRASGSDGPRWLDGSSTGDRRSAGSRPGATRPMFLR